MNWPRQSGQEGPHPCDDPVLVTAAPMTITRNIPTPAAVASQRTRLSRPISIPVHLTWAMAIAAASIIVHRRPRLTGRVVAPIMPELPSAGLSPLCCPASSTRRAADPMQLVTNEPLARRRFRIGTYLYGAAMVVLMAALLANLYLPQEYEAAK